MRAPVRAPVTLLGREDVGGRVESALGTGRCLLFGRPGDGRGAVARGIVARWRIGMSGHPAGDAVWVPLTGVALPGDAVRALGHALGAVPCGDAGALAVRLRARARAGRPLLLVLDGATPDAWDEVVAALGQREPDGSPVHILGTLSVDGDAPVLPADPACVAVRVPPLGRAHVDTLAGRPAPDADGSPRLACLVRETGLDVAGALARVRAVGAALLPFPVGVAGAEGWRDLPRAARSWGWSGAAFERPGRVALAGGVRARLSPAGDAAACAAALLPHVSDLLAWAEGGHLVRVPTPEDALLVRSLARALCDASPERAAVLGIAEARLLAAFGEFDAARGRLTRTGADPYGVRARAAWADGDLLAATGALEEALPCWDEAAQAFRRGGDGAREARVLRRSADRLLARSEWWSAERRYRESRSLARSAGDVGAVREAEVGLASAALAAGNAVRSALLLERGATVAACAQAPLAAVATNLQAGHLREADAGLHGLERAAGDDATARAVVLRRRADLALRERRFDAARELAWDAAQCFAALGEVPAQASSMRACGDAALAAGRLGEARALLHATLPLHVRAQDLRGLAHTLERLAALDDLVGWVECARERRAQVHEVRAALGES